MIVKNGHPPVREKKSDGSLTLFQMSVSGQFWVPAQNAIRRWRFAFKISPFVNKRKQSFAYPMKSDFLLDSWVFARGRLWGWHQTFKTIGRTAAIGGIPEMLRPSAPRAAGDSTDHPSAWPAETVPNTPFKSPLFFVNRVLGMAPIIFWLSSMFI